MSIETDAIEEEVARIRAAHHAVAQRVSELRGRIASLRGQVNEWPVGHPDLATVIKHAESAVEKAARLAANPMLYRRQIEALKTAEVKISGAEMILIEHQPTKPDAS